VDLVQDEERIREERKKAKKNKDKYVGMSGMKASMHYGMIKYLFYSCHFIYKL